MGQISETTTKMPTYSLLAE